MPHTRTSKEPSARLHRRGLHSPHSHLPAVPTRLQVRAHVGCVLKLICKHRAGPLCLCSTPGDVDWVPRVHDGHWRHPLHLGACDGQACREQRVGGQPAMLPAARRDLAGGGRLCRRTLPPCPGPAQDKGPGLPLGRARRGKPADGSFPTRARSVGCAVLGACMVWQRHGAAPPPPAHPGPPARAPSPPPRRPAWL